jgi:hypothetical protein
MPLTGLSIELAGTFGLLQPGDVISIKHWGGGVDLMLGGDHVIDNPSDAPGVIDYVTFTSAENLVPFLMTYAPNPPQDMMGASFTLNNNGIVPSEPSQAGVPEVPTLPLFATGLGLMAFFARRKRLLRPT